MKRLLLSVIVAAVALAPSYAGEKAPKNEKVKNVILIIGDGMGFGVTFSWMVDCNYGMTCFDRAQYVGVSKTYSANSRVTDSAASGSAMSTGNKTNNSMLGVLPDGTKVPNLADLAKEKGLSTGIVVTSYVLDATPAAFYAHVASRGDRKSIEEDLLKARPDILVGGGRKYFVEEKYVPENMIDKAVAEGFTYVSTPEEFYATDKTPILGLFSDESYPMAIERDTDFLMDAAMHTIEVLEKNKKGFFAMIEGSHIDHAAHANNAEQLNFEMEEFDKMVNAVFDYADTHKGTLVVVTADHDTGGVNMIPGSKDFSKGDSGLEPHFATTGHSGNPVPVFAYGASAWKFGQVMENTDIFARIKAVLLDRK
ncbi:MAG: alkaline phosphatase [Bacteroidales bacterium]|nr:alkaline phosphatase [Bacteroidales bacterium]